MKFDLSLYQWPPVFLRNQAGFRKLFSPTETTGFADHRRVSHGLGWPANAMFFLQQNSRKSIFTLPDVNDNEIVRSTSDRVEGKSGLIAWCAVFEAVGADVFRKFWLLLTMGRNKMALAGHPRTCETHLLPANFLGQSHIELRDMRHATSRTGRA